MNLIIQKDNIVNTLNMRYSKIIKINKKDYS